MRSEIILFFAAFIEKELGIIYSKENFFQLENRLKEIVKTQGLPNVEALYEQSKNSMPTALKQQLLDLATNNETLFFRDPKVFKAIEQKLLRDFVERYGSHETLRIWSAASSTGQEAVSLSILMSQFNLSQVNQINFSIVGTDISERVLGRARSGRYSQLEVQRGMSDAYLSKYFTKDEGDQWLVCNEIKNTISYSKLNLKERFSFPYKFHLVMCRNVLIYQSVESKIEIIKRLTETLMPGGYLILGSGESLLGLSDDFDQILLDGAVLYQKKMIALPMVA